MEEVVLRAHPSIETYINWAETVRIKFVKTLESGESFMSTKQILKQDKGDLKTVWKP